MNVENCALRINGQCGIAKRFCDFLGETAEALSAKDPNVAKLFRDSVDAAFWQKFQGEVDKLNLDPRLIAYCRENGFGAPLGVCMNVTLTDTSYNCMAGPGGRTFDGGQCKHFIPEDEGIPDFLQPLLQH